MAQWNSYQDIRRRVLFEYRGRFGVYNANYPEEHRSGHYPCLLLLRGRTVGTIRIDVSGHAATFRGVAIDSKCQGQGHGCVLLAMAEAFSISKGCTEVFSHVAPDAVGFYEKCGFRGAGNDRWIAGESVRMKKPLGMAVLGIASTYRISGRARSQPTYYS